jgi:Luciferase-like monooxygenase
MKLGLFGMPLHPPTRPIAETYEEDAERIIHADQVGFDEAWIGEHMSCTTEPIAAPMMFLASLIHRTKNIRFGTGVIAQPPPGGGGGRSLAVRPPQPRAPDVRHRPGRPGQRHGAV